MMIQGDAFCLNDGCNVVKSLIKISSLAFNLIGLFYFLLLVWLLRLSRSRPESFNFWISTVLLTGIGVEGVLLAFQIFVAQAMCSYCLVIFVLVLAMNLLGGTQQAIKSIFVLAGILIISALLNYGTPPSNSNNHSITGGTYASIINNKPLQELYLIFSEDCPHCHNVIKSMIDCDKCSFHFNPIDTINSLEIDLPRLKLTQSFSPEINRNFLNLMGLNTVPILIAKKTSGYSVIKGEQNLIDYIQLNCNAATKEKSSNIIPDKILQTTIPDSQLFLFPDEGECVVDLDCEDELKK